MKPREAILLKETLKLTDRLKDAMNMDLNQFSYNFDV